MRRANRDAVMKLASLMDSVDGPLKKTFENTHHGHRYEALVRFLKARDWNVAKAHKMLCDCLNWRIQSEIDLILAKPITPTDFYRDIRNSQLIGMSGYSREGLPVIAIGVGLSTYDKASLNDYVQSHIQLNEYRDRVILPSAMNKHERFIGTCIKVLDMAGLKLSALYQIKLLRDIATIDELNYPERTDAYYIVNVPYSFSACWKVVRHLLQERTRNKIQVLQGSGTDELLQIMDYASLPHFCKRQGTGLSEQSEIGTNENCFSFEHPFHQQLYSYVNHQASRMKSSALVKQGSFQITIESEFEKHGN